MAQANHRELVANWRIKRASRKSSCHSDLKQLYDAEAAMREQMTSSTTTPFVEVNDDVISEFVFCLLFVSFVELLLLLIFKHLLNLLPYSKILTH